MEEKIIIENKKFNLKMFSLIWWVATVVLALIIEDDIVLTLISSGVVFGIIVLAAHFTKIVVTDKRVYAEALFGRRLDLPLDSVSAVASGWLGQISIATPSGKIGFLFIGNAREIHDEVRKLLLQRQGVCEGPTVIVE